MLVALIDRKINQYMSINDGIVKKMEKDKYFFVIKKAYYKEMEKNKFPVLDEAEKCKYWKYNAGYIEYRHRNSNRYLCSTIIMHV